MSVTFIHLQKIKNEYKKSVIVKSIKPTAIYQGTYGEIKQEYRNIVAVNDDGGV